MFKLNAKSDADSLLYSLSHFECDGHTVHMLTQQCLPPPLTSTMKLSLFTHTNSSPLSLAARLHQCHSNYSHYLNNGWTSPRKYIFFSLSKFARVTMFFILYSLYFADCIPMVSFNMLLLSCVYFP